MPNGMATASSAGRHEAGEWFTHGRQAARSAGSAPLIRLAAHASDRLPRRHESPESIPPARRRAEPSAARLWGRLRDARGVGEHQARRGRPWRPRRRPRRPRRRRWRAGRVWSSLVFAGRSGLALRRDNFAGCCPIRRLRTRSRVSTSASGGPARTIQPLGPAPM